MKKSAVFPRKRPRRRSTRSDVVTPNELPRQLLQQIDRWRREHGAVTRSEAMRRLLAQALASASARRISAKFAAKASDLAGEAIDRLADSSVTKNEQAKRKRRLIKGPREFRTARRKARIWPRQRSSETGSFSRHAGHKADACPNMTATAARLAERGATAHRPPRSLEVERYTRAARPMPQW